MPRLSVRILLPLALAACSSPEQLVTPDVESLTVSNAKAAPTSAYTPADLGVFPGDHEAYAWAVNNSGNVVVQSIYYPPNGGPGVGRWYVKTGSSIWSLDSGIIRAISGGSPTYVMTSVPRGLLHTFSTAGGFSAPLLLDPINEHTGNARAVNDLGVSAGAVGWYDGTQGRNEAAIWNPDGTGSSIPNPGSYAYGEARDINNSGDAVIEYNGRNVIPDRGYLRTTEGAMIELLPLPGHRSTYARGVSERINGMIYVAGISDDDNGRYSTIRWAVDVVSGAVTAEIGQAQSYSMAMTDDGSIVGVISGASTSGFIWKRGSATTALKTPKGSGNGRVWGVSGDGRYIAGDAKFGSYRRAVLWTAP
jgi:hypothetical protein